MKKVALSLVLVLICGSVFAEGLNASFIGSRFDCPDDPSIVACYKGVVDGSNNLIDFTENLLTDRTEFDDWTQSGTCAVTADQWRNPVDGSVDADYLDNTGGANTDHRYLYSASTSSNQHTGSVWVRVDTPHNITVVLNENGVGVVDTNTFAATTYWRRISVSGSGTGVGAIGLLLYPGENGTATGTAYFYGAQIVENDEYLTGMGIFINPSDQSITKPRHDLAAVNSPVSVRSHYQVNGNKSDAVQNDGTNSCHSIAHHNSFNIFDNDHTITMALKANADGQADGIISHQAWNISGILVYSDTLSNWYSARYMYNGGSYVVSGSIDPSDLDYHFLQIVRDTNYATVYTDGDAGTPVDVTGAGLDGNQTFNVGAANGAGGTSFDGDFSYLVIRERALSTDELAAEREMILGTKTNWSDVNAWTFDRSTTAYKTFSNQYENTYPSHSMDLVAADHPRVAGQGGGLLVEDEDTQLHGLTEAFDSWSQSGTCAVTADDYVAPNGTATADLLDNTGGGNQDHRTVMTDDLGDLTGRTFTASVWMRADTPHICSFYVWENGVGHVTGMQDVYVTTEWQRFHTSGACAGGGTGAMAFSVVPGDWNTVQGTAHFWGANLTETPFPVSYIPNAGVGNTQVTRTADDITLDPHPAGTNEIVLPLSFTPTGPASKLTVYGEFKCEFHDNTEIKVNHMLLSISGDTGAGERQADSGHNCVVVYVDAGSQLEASLQDSGGTDHMATTVAGNPVAFDEWFSVRVFFDLADFSRMNMWVQQCPGECYASGEDDSGMTFTNNTGTGNFYTDDTLVRPGQWQNGTVNAYCKIRNLRIIPAEVTP